MAVNPIIEQVELTHSGAKSTIFHGFGETKMSAVKAIKPGIEKGKIISVTRNYENKGIDRYVIASNGKINGKDAYVGVIIKSYPNNKNSNSKFYLHEAIIIETDSPIMTAPQLSVDTVSESASTDNIFDNGEKVNRKIPVLWRIRCRHGLVLGKLLDSMNERSRGKTVIKANKGDVSGLVENALASDKEEMRDLGLLISRQMQDGRVSQRDTGRLAMMMFEDKRNPFTGEKNV